MWHGMLVIILLFLYRYFRSCFALPFAWFTCFASCFRFVFSLAFMRCLLHWCQFLASVILHSAGGSSAEVEAGLHLVSLNVLMLHSVFAWSLRDIFPEGHHYASSQFGLVASLGLHCAFGLRSSAAFSVPGLSVPEVSLYFFLPQ